MKAKEILKILIHAPANNDFHSFLAEEFWDLFGIILAYLQSPPGRLSPVVDFHDQDTLTVTLSWGNPRTIEHNCQFHGHPGKRVANVTCPSLFSSCAILVPQWHYCLKLLISQNNLNREVNWLTREYRKSCCNTATQWL